MSLSRDGSGRPTAQRQADDNELLAPQTQVVVDRDAYLGDGAHEVGRRISDDQVELFISGDVANSLEQEFIRYAPDFIALHDVGVSASLRQLNSLAGAAGARVQRLSVRRQGHGVALAVLQFVEVPLANGNVVRVYSTDVNADSQARARTAMVLLAYSRLGVLMVGELPPHALTTQLRTVNEALRKGPWPNQDLLLVPLGAGTAMAVQAAQLGAQSHVLVHVTPHAASPKQAWNFIGGAWNQLQGKPGSRRELPVDMAQAVPRPTVPPNEASTQPMGLHPLGGDAPESLLMGRPPARPAADPIPLPLPPQLPHPLPLPVPGATQWQDYAERCASIKGALSVSVFDMHSSESLAHAGGSPAAERLAQQGSALLVAMNNTTRALGLGSAQAEAAISTPAHHLLLRPVPGHPGIAVHLVVLANHTSVSLAHMQLERIESPR